MLSSPSRRGSAPHRQGIPRPGRGSKPVSQAEVNAVVTLYQSGKIAAALDAARRLARRAPDLVPLLDLQGACLQALGDYKNALGFFKRSLKVGGGTAIAHFNVGAALYHLFALEEATKHLSQAVTLEPNNARMAQTLAMSLDAQGHHMEAVQVLSSVVERGQVSDELLNMLGQCLRNLGKLDEAKACHEAVTSTAEAGAQAHYNLGLIASAEGDKETARGHLEQAVEISPTLTPAHRALSNLIDYDADHPHLKYMLRLLEEASLGTAAEIELRFALHKALNDAKQYEAAFTQLERGNSLKKKMIGYSVENEEELFSYLKKIFARPTPVASSDLPFRPIFIVGLPRSGSTVTERILCGAPGVTGAGELQYPTTAMFNLLKQMQTEGQSEFTQAHAQALRDALGKAMQSHADEAPVVIDKMPLNFRWVGGLLAAFPEARIVYTTRPARDMAWSLYKVGLQGSGNGFIYDMDDIIRYQALADDLMQHWMTLFPDQIYRVDYDQLTREPEKNIRPLVDFCKLEWSEDCLHPENQKSAIRTASSQQARKPIYHRSTPDWLPYESYLTTAFEKLDQLDI